MIEPTAAATPDPARSVLVLVDYQARLLPAIADGAQVLGHALALARLARTLGIPVIGTEENAAKLGPNVEALRALCDETLAKMHFDACGDGLLARLAAHRPGPAPRDVVLAGCEAHVCLLQTALGVLRSGDRVWLVPAACGSRRMDDHALAMTRLQQAGAVCVNLDMLAFEWLRTCEHPQFRAVLAQVKAR